ncbi:MAG: single-stranded DNA-binding protein [Candidatus Aenigmatarchaeota archaeon]
MNLNKVLLIGRLVQDVDFKIAPSGTPIAIINLATNRLYKDKSGANKTETEFHRVVAWGKLAELCRDYLTKGRLIFVEGRIHYRTWLSADGTKKVTTEIIAENIIFGPRPSLEIVESEEIPEELKEFEEPPPDIWEIQF